MRLVVDGLCRHKSGNLDLSVWLDDVRSPDIVVLGSALDKVNNLGPELWPFNAMVRTDECAHVIACSWPNQAQFLCIRHAWHSCTDPRDELTLTYWPCGQEHGVCADNERPDLVQDVRPPRLYCPGDGCPDQSYFCVWPCCCCPKSVLHAKDAVCRRYLCVATNGSGCDLLGIYRRPRRGADFEYQSHFVVLRLCDGRFASSQQVNLGSQIHKLGRVELGSS